MQLNNPNNSINGSAEKVENSGGEGLMAFFMRKTTLFLLCSS
jgi:hypothetical protein